MDRLIQGCLLTQEKPPPSQECSTLIQQYHTMEASTAFTQSMSQTTTTKLAALTEKQQRWETNQSLDLKEVASRYHTRDSSPGRLRALQSPSIQ